METKTFKDRLNSFLEKENVDMIPVITKDVETFELIYGVIFMQDNDIVHSVIDRLPPEE